MSLPRSRCKLIYVSGRCGRRRRRLFLGVGPERLECIMTGLLEELVEEGVVKGEALALDATFIKAWSRRNPADDSHGLSARGCGFCVLWLVYGVGWCFWGCFGFYPPKIGWINLYIHTNKCTDKVSIVTPAPSF